LAVPITRQKIYAQAERDILVRMQFHRQISVRLVASFAKSTLTKTLDAWPLNSGIKMPGTKICEYQTNPKISRRTEHLAFDAIGFCGGTPTISQRFR
jgi:hypothetical protein